MRPIYQDQFTQNPITLVWQYIKHLLGLQPPPMYLVTPTREDVCMKWTHRPYHYPAKPILDWLREQDTEYLIWQVPYIETYPAIIKIQFRNQDTAALYKLTFNTMEEDPNINHLMKPTTFPIYIN